MGWPRNIVSGAVLDGDYPTVFGEHFLLGPTGQVEVHRVKVHPEDITRTHPHPAPVFARA